MWGLGSLQGHLVIYLSEYQLKSSSVQPLTTEISTFENSVKCTYKKKRTQEINFMRGDRKTSSNYFYHVMWEIHIIRFSFFLSMPL